MVHLTLGDDAIFGRRCEIAQCRRLVECLTQRGGVRGSERFCFWHRGEENPCPICSHDQSILIELAMATDEARTSIADRFGGLPWDSFDFHRKVCRPDLDLARRTVCSVCTRPDVDAIEAALKAEPLARVARSFGIGVQTLGNHQAHADDPLHAARIADVATRRLQTIQTITKENAS